MTAGRVLGVDACPAGWVGVTLKGSVVRALVADDIRSLVEAAGPVAVVAIDIPIGLPDAGRRRADVLARAAIGPRRSSVFMTPVRTALLADSHAEAVERNRRLAGEGVSVQAFSLKRKLLQVDSYAGHCDHPLIEVHPEVSFARLAGAPLTTRKSTWAGMVQRRNLLTGAGIRLDDDFGLAGARCAVDDLLDAAVVAWTAQRYAAGDATPVPDPPEVFSDGWPAAIWS